MSGDRRRSPGIDYKTKTVLDIVMSERPALLEQRIGGTANVPLRFWNQQAHFTTPASGKPQKAIRGLAPVAKLLDKFGITLAEIEEYTGAPTSAMQDLLNGDHHSPFVMVDAEDAVALNPESIAKARQGALECFADEDWGRTLPFFRPSGLKLDTCAEDLVSVLTNVTDNPVETETDFREPYPVAGIVWPKVEHVDEIRWVCEILERIEDHLMLPDNEIKLEFLVESGRALINLPELIEVTTPRLVGIIWGIADYSADINLPAIENAHPACDWARHVIVNAAGAVEVPAIDCMTLNYPTPVHRGEDLSKKQQQENSAKILSALKEAYDDAMHGIGLGMSGKWVGHPLQLLMVETAFRDAIPEHQVERDLKEIEDYRQSVVQGDGATMLGDGQNAYMADRATDRHIRARLRKACAWGKLAPETAHNLEIISGAELAEIQG